MPLQYGELGRLAAEIVSLVWGTPANLISSFFPRLISVVKDWMSIILPHIPHILPVIRSHDRKVAINYY